ncbi:MAG: ABC transporter ATP-binding protein [Candidatus Thermoplasmatota archaeon]|nr:ABC transporter ATP-binding protein [Candidatus Thermoplasmatota archaeon]
MHLTKAYGGIAAVDDISFSVNKGEVFAFLGPNGAGKTTTVEMIESIRTPESGTIRILGRDIKNSFHEVKERIGILPQEFHSFERLTVRETLQYFSMLFKHRASIDSIISAMNLKADEKKVYKNLSGGLKQRVGVAIALVNDPDIIFLDEPTTGLDPKARREVWEVIEGLKQQGKTVFLTTHYMEEAEYLADHIAIIHKGKIIAEGTLDELIDAYGSENILLINNCKTDDAAEVMQAQGFEVAQHRNGDLEVKISYKDQVLEVLSHLRHECIEYDNISIRRSNLEEIFLKLTGAKLSEAAP